MTITELIAKLEAIRALEGDLDVVTMDTGSSDDLGVVRVEGARVTDVVVYELGNGMAGRTLDDAYLSREGRAYKGVLLD